MDYHFTSLASMREAVARGDFIEHAEVCILFRRRSASPSATWRNVRCCWSVEEYVVHLRLLSL